MFLPVNRTLQILALSALFFPQLLQAGAVRVSFLRNSGALGDTVEVLKKSGCGEQAARLVQQVVGRYYASEFTLDFSKFPKSAGGFYSFATPRDLVAALPHRLCDTQHPYDFTCFDTLIALAGDRLKTGLQPDEVFGPFMVSTMTTNGEGITFRATARDAFAQLYPRWYRDATASDIPQSMQDGRICLTAALFCWHLLPESTSEKALEDEVMGTLKSNWRQLRLRFPAQFEVVLCHKIDLSAHTICTTHGGLLLHRNTAYTYIEKAGGRGPFVRLDFDVRSDVIPWLAAVFSEREHRSAHLFATFNDSNIRKLDSK